jgi:hypothetical protein
MSDPAYPCPTRYDSEEAADTALLNAKLATLSAGSQPRREKHAQYCRPCRAWHLVKTPKGKR